MKTWNKLMVMLIFAAAIVLSACNDQNPEATGTNNSDQVNIDNVANEDTKKDLDDPSVIPSETGDKKQTTNEQGTTYSGMGQNIYSSIGSSGIHTGGISSYFESILKGVGITGVKVFVVDDSVILARKKEATTSHEYSNMQRNLLSGTEGESGKGEPEGINGSTNESQDNMKQAKEEINDMFNGNVKILTATDPQALDVIKSIEKNIKSSAYQKASDNLLKLLKMTE